MEHRRQPWDLSAGSAIGNDKQSTISFGGISQTNVGKPKKENKYLNWIWKGREYFTELSYTREGCKGYRGHREKCKPYRVTGGQMDNSDKSITIDRKVQTGSEEQCSDRIDKVLQCTGWHVTG